MSQNGARRGGRQKGAKNKATIEREERARAELAEQVKGAVVSGKKFVIAKDELLELIPVVKGTVAEFQKAAIGPDQSGLPGRPGFDRQKWGDLKDWMQVLESICRHAAEFQSPKFKAVAVAIQDPSMQRQEPKTISVAPTDAEGRERAASAAYLKLVKG